MALIPSKERKAIFPYSVWRLNEKTSRWLLVSQQPTKAEADYLADGMTARGLVVKVKSERVNNPRSRAKSVKRPSQTTKKAPSKRLVSRRKATLLGPAGYYANPKSAEKLPYHVQEKLGTGTKRGESASGLHGGTWLTLSQCATAAVAKWLAEHYSKHHPDATIRVVKV